MLKSISVRINYKVFRLIKSMCNLNKKALQAAQGLYNMAKWRLQQICQNLSYKARI